MSGMGFSLVQLLNDLVQRNTVAAGLRGKPSPQFNRFGPGDPLRLLRWRDRRRDKTATAMLRLNDPEEFKFAVGSRDSVRVDFELLVESPDRGQLVVRF